MLGARQVNDPRPRCPSMQRRLLPWLAALPVYVFLSSWLGLTSWPFPHPEVAEGDVVALGDAWEFFADVWQDGILADLIFALGTAAVGGGAFWLLRLLQDRPVAAQLGAGAAAGIASLLLNWVVYGLSFNALSDDLRGGGQGQGLAGDGEVMRFVWDWGWPGLLFTALAPFALAMVWAIQARRETAEAPTAQAGRDARPGH